METDVPYTRDELTAIVVQAVMTTLRSEGVSGAGDASHMLQTGFQKAMVDTNVAVLRSEGISGAGDAPRMLQLGYRKAMYDESLRANQDS